ncbi:MAG: hypothetical protein WBO19_04385, partial [Terriglobia bacterium]
IKRLRFYHAQLAAYTNAVEKALADAEQRWIQLETELMASGPSMFKDPQWHRVCKEVCYWPGPLPPPVPPRPAGYHKP